VFGVYLNSLITEVDAANLSLGRMPSASSNPSWYLLLGFAAVTTLLWGQVYCGMVCPFGALQELVSRLGRRLGLRSYAVRRLDLRARYTKFAIAAGVMTAFWITGDLIWVNFNPMQSFFAWRFTGWVGWLAALSLLGALFYYRFWCRVFCPLGALLALGNKLSFARRWAPRRNFNYCDLGVRDEFDVDCIQCNRCVSGADIGVRGKPKLRARAGRDSVVG